jgi:NTP pyrophosphatase (non-canonical NTP hydrolase)
MINQILAMSASINNNRSVSQIFTYTIEEIGELATELNIADGYSKKEPGSDGVIGEAVDAIICLVDLIYKHNPTITEADLLKVCAVKLAKWENSAS